MTTISETITYSLIGDIGGTNTRLQLIAYKADSQTPKDVKTQFYRTRDHSSLVDTLKDFLKEYEGSDKYPHNATLAVAGAPYEGKVTLPNTHWPTLDQEELEKEFKIPFSMINDFVSIGYSMIKLTPEEIITVHDAKKHSSATMIVTGPGTGMGECVIQPTHTDGHASYTVFGTEGGHKNFAPTSQLEWEYLNYVLAEFPEIKERVGYLSTEKAFCGPGIPNIYKFFCKKEDVESEDLTSEEIIKRGLAKEDKICKKVLDFFITLYAKEISNFALNSLPYGGIYLVGGLTNAVSDYMMNDPTSPFKEAYFSKGKTINNLLTRFPIYIVKTVELGLHGAFVKAQQDSSKL